jgi:GNAT superfamily N-acetyltransferase
MSETVGLRDGSRVRLRPIRPSDKSRLRAGFERLGPESRYQRFLVATDQLTDAAVEYLTDVDHHDHEAIVALDEATGDGVGVARFVRLADRADTAEAAVTVVDDWQGRGVGTLLLDCLADRARSEGIARFWALLLAENRDMLDLLERLGPVRMLDRRLGTVEVEAELASTGAGDELRSVLRASARCDVRPHPDAAAR